MPRLFEFHLNGKLHLDDWISAKLRLSEINEGFADIKAGKTLPSMVEFNDRNLPAHDQKMVCELEHQQDTSSTAYY
jgi:hypothetical protein